MKGGALRADSVVKETWRKSAKSKRIETLWTPEIGAVVGGAVVGGNA